LAILAFKAKLEDILEDYPLLCLAKTMSLILKNQIKLMALVFRTSPEIIYNEKITSFN
jgi:hypothetical protein